MECNALFSCISYHIFALSGNFSPHLFHMMSCMVFNIVLHVTSQLRTGSTVSVSDDCSLLLSYISSIAINQINASQFCAYIIRISLDSFVFVCLRSVSTSKGEMDHQVIFTCDSWTTPSCTDHSISI